MKQAAMILVAMSAVGCCSLPSDIAMQAAETSQDCEESARKTFNALNVLEYDQVTYVQGYPFSGAMNEPLHAWVEYLDAGHRVVVDPYRINDRRATVIHEDDLMSGEYQREFVLHELPVQR